MTPQKQVEFQNISSLENKFEFILQLVLNNTFKKSVFLESFHASFRVSTDWDNNPTCTCKISIAGYFLIQDDHALEHKNVFMFEIRQHKFNYSTVCFLR